MFRPLRLVPSGAVVPAPFLAPLSISWPFSLSLSLSQGLLFPVIRSLLFLCALRIEHIVYLIFTQLCHDPRLTTLSPNGQMYVVPLPPVYDY